MTFKLVRRWSLALVAMVLATSCSIQQVHESASLDSNVRWALLPIVNLAQAPLAGERTETVLATRLRSLGLSQLTEYPASDSKAMMGMNSDQKRFQEAKKWAIKQNFQYWITGSVEEWRYKAGLDGEPAVAISLRVIEAQSGKVVWSGSGARTGWGREGVLVTAHEVLDELLDSLPLTED